MLHSIEIDFTNSGSNVPAKEDQEQLAIHLSKKILEFLKAKISDHNSKEGANKTNISQLKTVFCDGFDQCVGGNKLAHAIARVDAFLKVKSEGFDKKYFDEKLNLKISEADLTASSQQAEESGLKDFQIDNLEDLYIQEDYTTNFDYYV